MKKSILIIALLLVGVLLQRAFAQNYIVHPSYREGKVRFYAQASPINPATVAYELNVVPAMLANWNVAPDGGNGANDALIYNNKLFVSFDLGLQKGGVLVYNMLDIAAAPTVIKPGGGTGTPCAGMAIQPNTGNLYIATFSNGINGADGGIYYSTAASGYTNNTLFAGYNNSNAIDLYTANVAFDTNNNLWATTWSGNPDATQMFISCFKNTVAADYRKIINTATNTYTATSTGMVTQPVHLLSAPEGIVRDASGNLWFGNNNDVSAVNGAGIGTLVKLTNAWVNSFLAMPIGTTTTVPNLTANLNIYYIPSGKLGGMALSGNTLYINDQGQAQGSNYLTNGTVWRYDVTTAFTTTNFKASGIRATYPGNGQMAFSASLPVVAAPATKVFVNATATGTNNGTSWANAYTNLQMALNNTNVDTVFVKNGTYTPNSYPNNCNNCTDIRNYCFFPHNNAKIYGGFMGTEKWITQRQAITTSNTILSGDIGAVGNNADNSYHVVLLFNVENVIIDGFTVQDGVASGESTITLNVGTAIPITNSSGAGIFAAGGGSNTNLTIQNCTMRNNNIPSSAATSQYYYPLSGAGLYLYDYNTINMTNNTFTNNNSIQGGGVYFDSYSSGYAGFTNCTFTNNIAIGNGGGMLVTNGLTTNLIFNNTIFDNNTATNGGGLALSGAGTPTILNTVFANNKTHAANVGSGAGLYISNVFNYNILNTTFYNNYAQNSGSFGGGLYENNIDDSPVSANPTIKNCIFWANITGNPSIFGVQDQLYSNNTNPNYITQVSNCLIKGSNTLLSMNNAGSNIIGDTFDPLFTNPSSTAGTDGIYRTVDDGLHLTCVTSPALNVGNNTPTLTDITNATRQGIADIGAYESPCGSPTIFTSGSAVCQSITQNAVTGNAWFHFTNNLGIVCSINPQGQSLGNVTAKVADPTGIVINGVTRYLGRSVNLTSTVAPTSNYLLRMYFKDTEITEFQTATGQTGLTPNSFNVLWSSGGTGCGVSNFYGTSGGVVPAQNGVATGEFGASNEGFYLQVALNHFTLFAASTDQTNTLVGTDAVSETYTDAVIYPNPTTNDIHINISSLSNDTFSACIYDMMGHKMTNTIPIYNNEAIISMQDMPNNIYTIVIIQNDKVILSKRVVKM